DSYSEIDFDLLPDKFVLKTNHGASSNLIVKDKYIINHKKEKAKFDRWLSKNFAFSTGTIQLQYRDIKPRIIAEEYVVDSNGELNDYRFMCFNGKVYYCMVDVLQKNGPKQRNIYDLDWNVQPWQQGDFQHTSKPLQKPKNFDLMIKLAEQLC